MSRTLSRRHRFTDCRLSLLKVCQTTSIRSINHIHTHSGCTYHTASIVLLTCCAYQRCITSHEMLVTTSLPHAFSIHLIVSARDEAFKLLSDDRAPRFPNYSRHCVHFSGHCLHTADHIDQLASVAITRRDL